MSLFLYQLAKNGKDIDIGDRDHAIINGLPAEVFTNAITVKAIVCTVTGISVFDDTNTERVATHKLCLEYVSGVTSEKWILFKGKRLKILTVENCCEEDKVLILMCTERGTDSKVVNDA